MWGIVSRPTTKPKSLPMKRRILCKTFAQHRLTCKGFCRCHGAEWGSVSPRCVCATPFAIPPPVLPGSLPEAVPQAPLRHTRPILRRRSSTSASRPAPGARALYWGDGAVQSVWGEKYRKIKQPFPSPAAPTRIRLDPRPAGQHLVSVRAGLRPAIHGRFSYLERAC